MKEAAGEANLTVVAIILIGVVVAVVTPLVNSLMSSTANRACCTDAGGYVNKTDCILPNNQIESLSNMAKDGKCTGGGTTGGTTDQPA